MADTDQQNPDGTDDDLDLRSFYRDSEDAARYDSARTALGENIGDFHRSDSDAYGRESVEQRAETDQPLPNSLYTAPQWHPGQAAEAEQNSAGAAAVPDQPPSIAATADAEPIAATEAEAAQIPPSPAARTNEEVLRAGLAKLGENPIVRFAVVGGFLGILFAACLIGLSWLLSKPAGPYDLGPMTSNAVGLRGHLFTKWDDDKLQYRLSFEPSDPDLHTLFALAVGNPPQPLSIGIQLKDSMGFVLCTREVVLKYDPAIAAAAPAPQTGTADSSKPDAVAPAPSVDAAQAAAAEKQREQGKDIFQSQNGADGQIASINAQGTIPCSEDAYGKVTNWSFTPNFPSLSEQNDLLKQESEKKADAERAAAARKRATNKPADKTLRFSIEGDDAIVGYDAGAGILESGTGESFYVDKEGGQANLAGWQAFPIRIHYRCDSTSYCTLTRAGSGVALHARLRK
jgi:hypothetical protein